MLPNNSKGLYALNIFNIKSQTEAMRAAELLGRQGITAKSNHGASRNGECGCYMQLTVAPERFREAQTILSANDIIYEIGEQP